MTEYIIQAKEKCGACDGTGKQQFYDNDDPLQALLTIDCTCKDGYVYREVPLVEALGKVRAAVFTADGEIARLGVRIEE